MILYFSHSQNKHTYLKPLMIDILSQSQQEAKIFDPAAAVNKINQLRGGGVT